MRVAITGGTGFIGATLREHLRAEGHDVQLIGRARANAAAPEIPWDPSKGILDPGRLEGIDAVVHLAGEPIAQRWTDSSMAAIRSSRVQGTSLLARTLAGMTRKPSVLVSMSGIGIYGDRGDETLTEASAAGGGFLGALAQEWESAAQPARDAAIRVVHPRLGLALHRDGGALAKMLPVFQLGLGGRIGTGQQWMSWISREDVVRAIGFMLTNAQMTGAANLVAPTPVRNEDFTAALGHAVHRPALAAVPAFAIRVAFGQMGVETVLSGQRAVPAALLAAGFQFRHPDLATALVAALRRN